MENKADTPGGGDAIGLQSFCSLELSNSIIALNGAQSCSFVGVENVNLLTSKGSNIDAGNSCGLTGPQDLINTDPLLAPLTTIGSTSLYPLRVGSPAIDSGDNALCTAEDQRGVTRAPSCDCGAFEY